jgi:predicted amidohydrolase YtcJ
MGESDMSTNAFAPELVLCNGRITTNDSRQPEVSALAIRDGLVCAAGDDRAILAMSGEDTLQINLQHRRVIPGLNDSHLHVIRAGLFYNLELRWDGVPRIAEALRRLKEQAQRTPPPQWVRVIGGWSELQFAEGRMPTLEEINAAAPETPVFVLHLYDCALLNRAALRALSFDENSPNPPGGVIARDARGKPTGLLIAEPNALILYSAIANAPRLNFQDQLNSTRHFMRELNRFGITSASDAGGGGQNYPEDYAVIRQLANDGDLTVRIAYSLFAQKSGTEMEDYERWLGLTHPGDGDDLLRVNGAGENLVWSAADFENFLQPRPELRPVMEIELEQVIRRLAEARWPWRIHATYDESIGRFLDLFERVHRTTPIDDLRWFIDHAETISPQNIERIQKMGGGIAVQHRMAFQGEYFIRRYGRQAVEAKPPIRKMIEMGVSLGAGTDGTRVASYHPWTCLWWLVSGKSVGGLLLNVEKRSRLSRKEALMLYTSGSAWFSKEDHCKGRLAEGYFADLAVLNADYFSVDEEEIRGIESVLTIVGGKPVYGAEEFKALAPPMPPVSPGWSPVAHYGGYDNSQPAPQKHTLGDCGHLHANGNHEHLVIMGPDGRFWSAGCPCAL